MKSVAILGSVSALLVAIANTAHSIPASQAPARTPAQTTSRSETRVQLLANGTRLQIQQAGRTYTINANDLNVQVLNALDCNRTQLAERQTLRARRFFSNSIGIDSQTGNVAIGALLQECFETQVSAVFVIDPQPNGAHAIYRVQVPGTRPLPDEFSTYPLSGLNAVGYLDGNLLVKHSDASGSQALLVFSPATTPAGQFVGCVYTQREEGDRLCPPNS